MPAKPYRECEILSEFGQAKAVEDRIVAEAEAHHFGEDDVFALRLSLEEALTNAIRHGNVGDGRKKVRIRYQVNQDRIDVYVADEGSGFDPDQVPDPTQAENLELPTGRGIMLMRAYMNEVEYSQMGNTVHLVKVKEAC